MKSEKRTSKDDKEQSNVLRRQDDKRIEDQKPRHRAKKKKYLKVEFIRTDVENKVTNPEAWNYGFCKFEWVWHGWGRYAALKDAQQAAKNSKNWEKSVHPKKKWNYRILDTRNNEILEEGEI